MELKSGQTTPTDTSGRPRRVVRAAGLAALLGGAVMALSMLAHPGAATAAGSSSATVAAPVCGQQRNLNNPTNTHNKVLDSYWFAVTHNGNTTAVCTLENNVKAGDTVIANLVLATPLPTGSEITLVSNNAPPPNPHQQTLFDCASFGDTGGASDPCTVSTTLSLTVNVPNCGFQVDLIYDEPITPLTQGTYLLQHRFVNGVEGKNATCTSPSISTTPVPTATTVGQSIKDTATVTPSTTTGTVTFNLFAPADPTCTAAPVFSSSAALSSGQATSGSFPTTAVGTYHWIASMTTPVLSSACGDESVAVSAANTPGITTTASAGGAIGTAVSDTATVTGVSSPTGDVVFKLFGVGDTTCAAAPLATDSEAISSSGTAHTTQTIKPQAVGTYQWTATYTGITPNISSSCGSEPVTLTAAGGVLGTSTSVGTPSTGVELPLPLGAGLVLAGAFVLLGEARTRRRLG